MISKEQAQYIYNLYSQIETTQKLIDELKEFAKECDDKVPAIIDKSYSTYGSICIDIPYFEAGKFSNKGARVFNISYPAALLILEDHLEFLKRELAKEGGAQ